MCILAKPTIRFPCAQMSQTIGFGIRWQKLCKVRHAKAIIRAQSTQALKIFTIFNRFFKVPKEF
jgi:hypothetical protein